MQSTDKVIAILCADLHLAAKPPVCRLGEGDWFAAMARPLREISDLSNEYDAPVLCAGDVFDRWNCSPELINFALENLPDDMYSIPGQHDLPFHRLDSMNQSAYGTMVISNTIVDLGSNDHTVDDVPGALLNGNIHVFGFPWGSELKPCPCPEEKFFKIALVHKFVWSKKETGYYGVSDTEHVSNYLKKLKGYDVVVFGDNHKGFKVTSTKTGQIILNCGTMMRRTIAEVDYRPRVRLMYSSGIVKLHYLDTTMDKLDVPNEVDSRSVDLSAFSDSLENLGEDPLDFYEAIDKAKVDCSQGASDVLTEVLDSYEE